MNAWIAFAFGVVAGVSAVTVFAPFLLASRADEKQAPTQKLASGQGIMLTLRSTADCEELGEAINALLRGLRWYCDGDNHPSTRVARQAIEDFRAATARFVDGKGAR